MTDIVKTNKLRDAFDVWNLTIPKALLEVKATCEYMNFELPSDLIEDFSVYFVEVDGAFVVLESTGFKFPITSIRMWTVRPNLVESQEFYSYDRRIKNWDMDRLLSVESFRFAFTALEMEFEIHIKPIARPDNEYELKRIKATFADSLPEDNDGQARYLPS